MKTNGATWKAYLASWPDGQYFDCSNETFDGVDAAGGEPADDAVVEFNCGVVFANEDDREGVDLVRHFKKWKKQQTMDAVTCWVPKDKAAEFTQLLRGMGGSVKS